MGQESVYRHVVLVKFKDGVSEAKKAEIVAAFGELPEKIDVIRGYEFGENVSPEGLDQGLTHCFLVTFADRAGLDVYLPHPAHKAFVERLLPVMDKATVVDFVP